MSEQASRSQWPLILVLVLGLLIYLFLGIEITAPGDDDRPVGGIEEIERLAERDDVNVLFILIDTLRADHMSTYGYTRETTPFIDEIAAQGIVFAQNAAQSSWTKASMASLWTALYPVHAGVTKYDHGVSEEARLPAEIMREAGFTTIGMYRNGWVEGYWGFEQGFDKYYRPIDRGLPPSVKKMNPNMEAHGGDDNVVADAVEFIRLRGRNERWFLYLHWMDLHEYTYDEDSAIFGSSNADLYDNSLRRNDFVFEDLYRSLGVLGMLDKTLIVIASDHGEAFGERGFEGHAREVFPETTWTPLIVSLPFKLDPGIVIEQRTGNVDLWPTLLDLLGLPDMGEVDGRSRRESILAVARGESPDSAGQEELLFSHLDENWGRPGSDARDAVSVEQGNYKFVLGSDFALRDVEALLDLRDGQRANRIDEAPEVADRLRQAALDHIDEPVKWAEGAPTFEIDEIQLNQLRALGYRIP